MIRHFEQEIPMMTPEGGNRFQWGPAVGAGLIPGMLLLLAPRGSPWAGVSFFSFVIMGRPVPADVSIPLPVLCLVHLLIAGIYGLIVAFFVRNVTQGRAVLLGGAVGLALYVINFGIVSVACPSFRGHEIGVLFTHVVFGFIAGGAYRGLLRRKAVGPAA